MNNIDSPLQVDRVYENFTILFHKYQQHKHKQQRNLFHRIEYLSRLLVMSCKVACREGPTFLLIYCTHGRPSNRAKIFAVCQTARKLLLFVLCCEISPCWHVCIVIVE